ncbi:MAG: uroporphyrinogen-III synthase [Polyangiaceae bacterium]|nr:uroporphyrinogen-III synthase [Polyangiaceae bacterium]
MSESSLHGARVVLLEARRESELASLVRRHGGEPVCVPALRELPCDCDADAARGVAAASEPGAVVVLATGVGLEGWLSAAHRAGSQDVLHAALQQATVVCRGPKPVAVLKREGLAAHVRAEPPHTSTELISALESVDVSGRPVVFVHDGGASRVVPEALAARGARLVEIRPYRWAPPEDPAALPALVEQILAGGIDVLAVTTQVQAQHLFDAAEAQTTVDRLRAALCDRVLVAAVGPTCAATLTRLGAPPHVVPESSKMGPLVLAIADALPAFRARRGD